MLQQNEYVVRVDKSPLWTEHKTVMFGMCMGNPNWEGEKFAATLEWASRHFDLIKIALSDTLGRHNYMMQGLGLNEAIARSRKQGDIWLDQHMSYLSRCGKPYEIVRWDHWLDHPDFTEIHKQFGRLASTGTPLSKHLDEEIKKHTERLSARGIKPEESAPHCFAYLIEELAGKVLRARAAGRYCRVYPSPEPEWHRAVRTKEIPNAPAGLENEYYVAINVRRRKMATIRPDQRPEFYTTAA